MINIEITLNVMLYISAILQTILIRNLLPLNFMMQTTLLLLSKLHLLI
jgi:hypothetical protein